MIRLPLVTLCTLLFATASVADTRYITDRLTQSLRDKPCAECEVKFQIAAGTEVTLLTTDPYGWAQVETEDGRRGWLPSGQLMFQPAARAQVEEYEQRVEALHLELNALKQQLTNATNERDHLRADLENLSGEEGDRFAELTSLRQRVEQTSNLVTQNQELLKNNNILQGEIDVLRASNEQLQSSQNQTWFLYGAIAMFLAAILAALLPHLKPRKRFSEWS